MVRLRRDATTRGAWRITKGNSWGHVGLNILMFSRVSHPYQTPPERRPLKNDLAGAAVHGLRSSDDSPARRILPDDPRITPGPGLNQTVRCV